MIKLKNIHQHRAFMSDTEQGSNALVGFELQPIFASHPEAPKVLLPSKVLIIN